MRTEETTDTTLTHDSVLPDAARPGEGARRHPPDAVVPPPVGEQQAAGGGQRHFRAALRELKGRQKPGHGVPAYMRWVNRRLGRPLAAAAFVLRLTPNQVTALSGLTTAAGLTVLVLAPRTVWVGVLVAALLALGFALDSADGQLARLSRRGGRVGEWVDHVVDAARTPAVHAAVGIALYLAGERGPLLLVPVVFAIVASTQFFSQILAEQLRSTDRAAGTGEGGRAQSFLLLPTDPGVLCWVFVLWGLPTVFAVAYVVLLALTVLHSGASMARRYRQLSAQGGPS